ncbi:MAG: UDP-N-acetylmuramoyl-L-alanine--D-glutamate ligase [Deltaproteobacteria bacterium]|nr:UDP-N-acetylmuramoyl-L-alanine--D-glutamate ligase [Deltaproteobacteria bacterium]MBW2360146.1 UDP-N-acetylmuramoyl-L-alanine--D-glutamate ligase [Deltaproteobacteria bacterium]
MEELAGKHVLVLGLGVTGRSAANFCAARGARVIAADERDAADLDSDELDAAIATQLGAPFPDAADFDLVVPSPGVPPQRYRAGARRVWGDVELAYRALAVPIVAVTGTNGKSTVTRLVEAGLCAAGLRARAAGNVGDAALELVGAPLDVAVLEVSSFQLETIETFRPRVAVVLNITPDHLDRHGSFDAYRDAKARILENQQPDDVAVLDFESAATRELAARARGRVVGLRSHGALEEGAWLDGDTAVLAAPGAAPLRVELQLQLAGRHNRENALAALAAIWAFGCDVERAATGIATFTGLPHRMERIARVAGVSYVNDSKATNPAAALRALESCQAPVVWIAGGRGKGLAFDSLTDSAARRARAAVLIGESADTLKDALAGRVPTHAATCLDAAVRTAAELARPGDVVLLAPACASQDQFRDFAARGECFRAAVHALEENQG